MIYAHFPLDLCGVMITEQSDHHSSGHVNETLLVYHANHRLGKEIENRGRGGERKLEPWEYLHQLSGTKEWKEWLEALYSRFISC